MRAVVIVAGEETPMRPLTATCPKPPLSVTGQSLLEHVLDACAGSVDEYVLVVEYAGEQVRETIGEEYAGHDVEYVEQDAQLGTAHAVVLLRDTVDDRFLVLNGVVVVDSELGQKHAAANGSSMVVKLVNNSRNSGVVALDRDQLTNIFEKPDDSPTDLANICLYAFEPDIFDYIKITELSERGEYEIAKSLQRYIDADGHVTAVEYSGSRLNVRCPQELLDANELLLDDFRRDIKGDVEDGATLKGHVVEEARVRNSTYIEGLTLNQSRSDIGSNAHVRGATVVGPDVHVGNAVEVKNSILMRGSSCGRLSYVGDSVLGSDVNFGAGTIVANLRHDENVRVRVKGESVDTGRRKFGVIAADGVKTGIDTSLNAGVKLGISATTEPNETVTRDRGEKL